MRSAYLLAAAFTAAFATQAWTQSPKVVMEEMTVPSEPGIEIYVRNKHPADMSAFRPERTLLLVHGATYPAHTSFDLQLDGLSWMDYIAARGYDVYLLDLRGYGRSTRPQEMDQAPDAQRADRARRDRRHGYLRGRRFHSQTPKHPASQPVGLVVGDHADGDLHHAEPRQGRAARALCAGVDSNDALALAAGRSARRLPHGRARAGKDPLAHRRARGQEGNVDPGRVVRNLGRRHLRHRSGGSQDDATHTARTERRAAGRGRICWSMHRANDTCSCPKARTPS